jgi:hypothetical protein
MTRYPGYFAAGRELARALVTMTKRREPSVILPPDQLLDLAFSLVIPDWDSRRSPLAHSIVPPMNANGASATPAPASER